MVEPHFPRLQHFSKIHTPMRTDKLFESEYADAVPTTKDELNSLEIEFGGSYLTLYGKLLHVATISRPQICNALSRLGISNTSFNILQLIPIAPSFTLNSP